MASLTVVLMTDAAAPRAQSSKVWERVMREPSRACAPAAGSPWTFTGATAGCSVRV
jgi:hypothetical protein